MKTTFIFIICLFIASCTSPYAARNMPEIPGIQAVIAGEDHAELTISNELPNNCEYRRNAVLLKAAYIALMHEYDHFDFTSEEDVSRTKYDHIPLDSGRTIDVNLCRGTCPLMYSADATSHILVAKFSPATWQTKNTTNNNTKCFLKD